MNKSIWKNTGHIERDFERALKKLSDWIVRLAKLAKGDITLLEMLSEQLEQSEAWNKQIKLISKKMVTPVSVLNYETWRKAAKAASKGNILYRALLSELNKGLQSDIDAIVNDNANLIKTLPTDTAKKVVNEVEKLAFKGKRAKDIEKYIVGKTSQHTRASARLIARTEVAKTASALTRARSERLGLNWYVWRTALDGDRVRKSHRLMEGVLVNWQEPPSPELLAGEKSVGYYHAGNIWNCRCYSEVVLSKEDLPRNIKVYRNGTIQKMSRDAFERLLM